MGQSLSSTEQRKDEMNLRAKKPRNNAVCISPGLENLDALSRTCFIFDHHSLHLEFLFLFVNGTT